MPQAGVADRERRDALVDRAAVKPGAAPPQHVVALVQQCPEAVAHLGRLHQGGSALGLRLARPPHGGPQLLDGVLHLAQVGRVHRGAAVELLRVPLEQRGEGFALVHHVEGGVEADLLDVRGGEQAGLGERVGGLAQLAAELLRPLEQRPERGGPQLLVHLERGEGQPLGNPGERRELLDVHVGELAHHDQGAPQHVLHPARRVLVREHDVRAALLDGIRRDGPGRGGERVMGRLRADDLELGGLHGSCVQSLDRLAHVVTRHGSARPDRALRPQRGPTARPRAHRARVGQAPPAG